MGGHERSVRPRQAHVDHNRLALSEPVFLQPDLLRKFDPMAVMNERLPTPRRMTDDQRADTIQVLKNTMALTRRETDPAT